MHHLTGLSVKITKIIGLRKLFGISPRPLQHLSMFCDEMMTFERFKTKKKCPHDSSMLPLTQNCCPIKNHITYLVKTYQSQNAKRASSQKRHMVISIFLLCNSLILMSIGVGSIRAIKGGLDKVFKIWDRHHRIHRQILR